MKQAYYLLCLLPVYSNAFEHKTGAILAFFNMHEADAYDEAHKLFCPQETFDPLINPFNYSSHYEKVYFRERYIYNNNRQQKLLVVCDVATNKELCLFEHYCSFSLSPNNTKFVLLHADNHTVTVHSTYDLTFERLKTYWAPKKVTNVTWSSNSRFLVAHSITTDTCVWDMKTGKRVSFHNLAKFLANKATPSLPQCAGLLALGNNHHTYFFTHDELETFKNSFPELVQTELTTIMKE